MESFAGELGGTPRRFFRHIGTGVRSRTASPRLRRISDTPCRIQRVAPEEHPEHQVSVIIYLNRSIQK